MLEGQGLDPKGLSLVRIGNGWPFGGVDLSPHHQPDEVIPGRVLNLSGSDALAVTKHGIPIRDSRELLELVRDVKDRDTVVLQPLHNFEKALERARNDQDSLYELAGIYEGMGDSERALDYYRRVVEVDRFSALGRLSLQRLEALKGTR